MLDSVYDSHFWWFLSRSSGIVSLSVLAFSMFLGVMLSARHMRSRLKPAWLLSLHRYCASLMIASLFLHVASLYMDSYAKFTPSDMLIPMASEWKPVAIAFGVISLYFIALVQITSIFMRRMPRQAWRGVHLTSYLALITTTVHAIAAGPDLGSLPAVAVFAGAGASFLTMTLLRVSKPVARDTQT